jgi:hypothetical protein
MNKILSFLLIILIIMCVPMIAHAEDEEIREYTQADMELIARVVYAESRGECFEGKVAVAAVIINRVNYYNSSVKSVVFAPNQFAVSGKYDDGCMDAVKFVIENDYYPLPINCLYFKNSGGKWRNFVKYCKIGGHYFYTNNEAEFKFSHYKFDENGSVVNVDCSGTRGNSKTNITNYIPLIIN